MQTMDFDASPSPSAVSPAFYGETEAMWQQIRMRGNGSYMESGPHYPERPDEPDCAYYLRTGLCRFGITCRFNHPPDRKLAIAAARLKGEYPERPGQPECQYYLKTGTCKFGPTCKFDHPKDKAGIIGRAQLNVLGYPLRPEEKECAYYMRTGQCKFGNTCKFHHPNPTNTTTITSTVPSSTAFVSYQLPVNSSASATAQSSFNNNSNNSNTGGLTSWPHSRASFIASPSFIVPQGLVQIPSWNTYPGQLVSVSSPDSRGEASGSNPSSSISAVQFALQRDNVFPERPDQPECQYYMKTGDCKFGAVCKFHHPRERMIPPPNCLLSPLGLPLRPGEPLCKFYSRYGICKFGPNCKFDHPMATPMGLYAYSYTANIPGVSGLLGGPTSIEANILAEGSDIG